MRLHRDDEVEEFRLSGQIDEAWYLEQYPDVRRLGMDAAEHFLWIGKRLGRKPKATFSDDVRQEAARQIIRTVEGSYAQTDSLCLFSHFDVHGIIDQYVINYLESLADCGLSTVFITTCENISDFEIRKIAHLVSKIVVKENVGRDFGSWYAGVVTSWESKKYKRVVLANDSVYGPLFDLKPVFEDMRDRGLDVWGITDSFETRYHIQTYFVVFEETFVNNQAFVNFWDRYQFEVDKRKVIDNFEIGLTSFAAKSGFRVGALCGYYEARRHALRLVDSPPGLGRAARQSQLTPVNSSHFFWRALVRSCHCPFLKIELLRDNPSRIDDVRLWREVLRESTTFDVQLIKSHLDRVKSN